MPRRTPRQERSKRRLERILAAADRVIAGDGFERLTIRRVAAAARVPVGSIYQFFPSKESLLEAVARRYIERFDELIDDLVEQSVEADWDDTIDAVFDRFVAAYRDNPGYVALWTGRHLSPALLRADDQNNERIALGLSKILSAREGPPDGPELRRACRVAVHVGDALLQLAFRTDPDGDEAILSEAKTILRSYLRDLSKRRRRSDAPARRRR